MVLPQITKYKAKSVVNRLLIETLFFGVCNVFQQSQPVAWVAG